MLDRSNLAGKKEEARQQESNDRAREVFRRVIDGLRLGYKQIVVVRLSEGKDYTPEGTTQVTLLGVAWAVWQLCLPLKPELHSYRTVSGASKDEATITYGYDIVVGWPDEAKRCELLGKKGKDAHIAEICSAFEAGLQDAERRARETLGGVQGACEAKAKQGCASVMELRPLRDFGYPANHRDAGDPGLKPEWLGEAASRVFAKLTADGDEPELIARGTGHDCYCDIVLRW